MYTARKYYDPKHKMRALFPSVFEKHFNILVDFLEDLQDEYDLRKKNYERISIPLMIEFGIKEDIPDTLSNDGIVLDPRYDANNIGTKDLDLVDWSADDTIDIMQIGRPVLDRSIH